MSLFFWILFPTFIIVIGTIYYVLRNSTKPKKNIILGVTLPFEGRNSAEVAELCGKFKRWLNIICATLVVISLGSIFFEKRFSLLLTYLMAVIFLTIFLPYIPYIRYNKKLRALKKEKGWVSSAAGKLVVDTKLIAENNINSGVFGLKWFSAPLLISLAALIYAYFQKLDSTTWGVLILLWMNLGIILMFTVLSIFIFRQRPEIIDSDTALSAALTRIRRHFWNRSWILMTYSTALWSVVIALFPSQMTFIVSTFVYAAVLCIIAIYSEIKIRSLQYKLTENSGTDAYVDEDDYWIWGLLYYNPNDNRVVKNERIGMGMTINLAKPAGKLQMVLAALAILLIPFMCVWMIAEDYTPKSVSISGDEIIAHHLRDEYVIKLDDITEAELVETLPSNVRVVGVGLDTSSKGLFNFTGYGDTETFINPKVPPFIYLETPDKNYMLGTDSADETKEIFEEIEANAG